MNVMKCKKGIVDFPTLKSANTELKLTKYRPHTLLNIESSDTVLLPIDYVEHCRAVSFVSWFTMAIVPIFCGNDSVNYLAASFLMLLVYSAKNPKAASRFYFDNVTVTDLATKTFYHKKHQSCFLSRILGDLKKPGELLCCVKRS